MAMPAPDTVWTADMARAIPDSENRYEVLDGVLVVSPAPSYAHQRVVFLLARILDAYVRAHNLGEVMIAPADVEFSNTRLLQPDVFVLPPTGGSRAVSFRDVGRLLLASEVSSPRTARVDRTEKRDTYRDERVPEYWIVDPDGRVIECWRPDDSRPEVRSTTISWQPDPGVPPLEIDLSRFFAEALD
jgi:Uma2 family endonuclease